MGTWGKSNPSKGRGVCKGPEAGMFVDLSRNSKERVGEAQREATVLKILAFPLSVMGTTGGL